MNGIVTPTGLKISPWGLGFDNFFFYDFPCYFGFMLLYFVFSEFFCFLAEIEFLAYLRFCKPPKEENFSIIILGSSKIQCCCL
jgi:hypothetical protein